MLWSLISSAYVIYLYRKLKAEQEPDTEAARPGRDGSIEAELDKLNAQLSALEARVGSVKGQETVP